MNFKYFLSFIAVATIVFVSCKKSPSGKPATTTTSGADVYVAGYINGLRGQSIAAYWKNGAPVKLTDSITTIASATGIAIQGTDVYVAGNTGLLSAGIDDHTAMYWKNGVATPLLAVQSAVSIQNIDALESFANGIAVQGNNVYVVGFSTPTVASLWINGVLTKLADDSYYSEAYAVTLQGSDVYVAGNSNVTGHSVATYWKNGVATAVLSSTPASISAAYAIAVSGNDVYLSGGIVNGYGETVAAWWKNGVLTTLAPTNLSNTNTSANGIYVYGNDVYVVGTSGNGATLWKNGTPAQLGGGNASAIVLQGQNVYVAGNTFNNTRDGAALWENSTAQIYGPPTSVANAIFVVPH